MNIRNLKDQPLDEIQVKKAGRQIKGFLIWLLKVVIIVGISYIILGPLITIVANSFFTANDLYNPVATSIRVWIIPLFMVEDGL